MSDQNDAGNKKRFSIDANDLAKAQEACNFVISLCNAAVNMAQYEHLDELSPEQKKQIDTMLQQLPSELKDSNGNGYTIALPGGLAQTLMQMRAGGAGPVMLGAFTAMAAITGQFFLVQINRQLAKINQSLDKIIDFLYEDKNAELIAEISFAQCAYQNYPYIMACDDQRVATISSLQQAKKVAMKDVEFYLNDIKALADANHKKKGRIESDSKQALHLKECLDLSIQLYTMSGVLEIYYAQNFNKKYINSVKADMCQYITKCKDEMQEYFVKLCKDLKDLKDMYFEEPKERPSLESKVNEVKESFTVNGNWLSSIMDPLNAALNAVPEKRDYYLTSGGDVYVKRLPN